jgi:hypothetical protein
MDFFQVKSYAELCYSTILIIKNEKGGKRQTEKTKVRLSGL